MSKVSVFFEYKMRKEAAAEQRRRDRAVALWAALVGAAFASVLWLMVRG